MFRDGFWSIIGSFFTIFKAQDTVKYSVFAIFVLKDNNVTCCKNTVNTDVFEGPCAEYTINTVVFGATCKNLVRIAFIALFGSKVSVFTVFFDPQMQKTA